MNNKYDIVIIGSGFSGLMCGAFLSKHGYSVCVLEKQPTPGGNLQTFKRHGKVFNTGLHYLGALNKGQTLYKIFKYLGLMDRITFDQLNPNCFDKVFIGEKEYCNASGYKNYENNLIEYFPAEADAIKKYVEKIRDVWNSNPFLNFKTIEKDEKIVQAFENDGLMDVMNSLFTNEDLKALLLANNGLYAGDPSRTPFYVHALINSLFIQSSFTIRGGSHLLAEALVQIIQEQNGVVLTKKEVVKIHTEELQAKYVVTEDGSKIYGDSFFSSIHPKVSISWFEKGVFRKPFVNRINKLENTIGSFVLYVSLKEKSFLHLNANVYYSKSEDVWGAVYSPEEWPKSSILYTTRDEENPDFAESATIITFMDYSEVEQWKDPASRKLNSNYKQFKDEKAQKLIKKIETKFPNFSGNIESYFSSTPLTYVDYTGIPEGSMYGVAKDYKNKMGTYLPLSTRVSNFFLTGQSIGIHGVMGVSMNAILASGTQVDINKLVKEIKEVD